MSNQSFLFNPQEDRIGVTGVGFKLPGVTTAQRLALTVTTSDAGLVTFDTTMASFYGWNGTGWTPIGGSSSVGFVINGIGNPLGVVSATGPTVYLDNTDPGSPVTYVKSTSGTSNNDWV